MPSNSSLSRRGFTIGAMLLAPAVTLAFPVFALTNREASDLIGQLVNDLNRIINSGKAETAMFRDFENLFNKYADVPIIARSSLALRGVRPQQRKSPATLLHFAATWPVSTVGGSTSSRAAISL